MLIVWQTGRCKPKIKGPVWSGSFNCLLIWQFFFFFLDTVTSTCTCGQAGLHGWVGRSVNAEPEEKLLRSILVLHKNVFCLFVLRFYCPFNTMGSLARSVYLITLFLGRLSPLGSKPVLCTFFRQKLTTLPFLNQQKGENDRRKYFMSKSPQKNVADPAGVESVTPYYQLGVHPTEPPRPAEKNKIKMYVMDTSPKLFLPYYFTCTVKPVLVVTSIKQPTCIKQPEESCPKICRLTYLNCIKQPPAFNSHILSFPWVAA